MLYIKTPAGRCSHPAGRRTGGILVTKASVSILLALMIVLPACGKTGDRAVVVKVNASRITVENLKNQIADLPPDALQMIAADPKARQSILDDVIAYELVLQEARRQGLENAEFIKRQDTQRRELERRLREEAKNELVSALLRKELGSSLNIAPPSDAEVKDFYIKNRDKMVSPDGRTVSLQQATPIIRDRLAKVKQRDIYMKYANTLREKARISINEKALESLAGSLAQNPAAPHQ